MDAGRATARMAMAHAGLDRAAAADLVDRARRAGADWSGWPVERRLRILRAFRDGLAADAQRIAARVDRRPPAETLSGEVLPLLAACRWLEAEAARWLAPGNRGRAAPWFGGARVIVEREPYGVVLIVGPANYGLMLPGIQCLQALAAGNAVIIKPAAGTRDLLREFGEILQRSGLPGGVLTIVDESIDSAQALLAAPVDRLVFTGSAAAGRAVLDAAAAALVPATLELSGWDACIVLESADIERAACAIAFALRFNNGETCLAPRRILVAREHGATLEARLVELLRDAAPQRFRARARAAATSEIGRALAAGARLAAGRLTAEDCNGPLLLTDVTPAMSIFRTEIFGPVALVTEVGDIDEAIRLANSTPARLGATVFGVPSEARAVAAALDAGVVVINDAVVPAAHPALPIAARGASGFGATRGPEGLLALTRPKAVAIGPRRTPLHLRAAGTADPALLAAIIAAAHRRGFGARVRALIAAARIVVGGPAREVS